MLASAATGRDPQYKMRVLINSLRINKKVSKIFRIVTPRIGLYDTALKNPALKGGGGNSVEGGGGGKFGLNLESGAAKAAGPAENAADGVGVTNPSLPDVVTSGLGGCKKKKK